MDATLERHDFMRFATRSYLDNTPDLVFFKDINLRYVSASLSFARMVGHESAEALVGKSDLDLFSVELAQRYTEDDRKVLESGVSLLNCIEPLPDQSGRRSYSSTSKHVIRDVNGRAVGLCGVGRDVTAQIELEEERERRELSRKMFEDVIEADVTENRMVRAESSLWVKAIGLTENSTYEEAIKAFAERFIHKDYAAEFSAYYAIDRLLSEFDNGVEAFSHVTYQRIEGVSFKWTEFCSRLYYARVSGTVRITTFLRDLDGEIKARQQLKRKAEIDALTGVLNREGTMEYIENCLAESEPGARHVLLFIDLDRFKQVNDHLGHPCGDRMLRQIAKRLKSAFRSDDIVGRVGGDEFLVLLKNVSCWEDAQKRAQRIFSLVPYVERSDPCPIQVTCSVGASLYAHGKTLAQLYAEADEAMYRAKRAGKNTLALYKPE